MRSKPRILVPMVRPGDETRTISLAEAIAIAKRRQRTGGDQTRTPSKRRSPSRGRAKPRPRAKPEPRDRREYYQEYYRANRERILKHKRLLRTADPDAARRREREYYRRNKERINRRRRERKRQEEEASV